MNPPVPQCGGEHDRRKTWENQRAALAEAFPAWKIVCVAHLSVPLWFALYREPLTFEQERAGFRPTMLCGSAEDLQAELALRCRTTRLPLPPPTPWKLISRKTGTTPYRLSPPSPAGRPSTFPNGHPAGLQGDPHPPQGPRRGG